MVKREIFREILIIVSEETEIASELITSPTKREDVVDARYILVKILNTKGFYASMIAPLICHKKRSVNYMLSEFDNRLKISPLMEMCYNMVQERIKKQQSSCNKA